MSACPGCGGVVACARSCRTRTHEVIGKPVVLCACGGTLPERRGGIKAKFCSAECPALEESRRPKLQVAGRKSAASFGVPQRFGGVR